MVEEYGFSVFRVVYFVIIFVYWLNHLLKVLGIIHSKENKNKKGSLLFGQFTCINIEKVLPKNFKTEFVML